MTLIKTPKPRQFKLKPHLGKAFALDKATFSGGRKTPFQVEVVLPRFACSDLSTVPTPLRVTLHHSARRFKSCSPLPPLSSNSLLSLVPFEMPERKSQLHHQLFFNVQHKSSVHHHVGLGVTHRQSRALLRVWTPWPLNFWAYKGHGACS